MEGSNMENLIEWVKERIFILRVWLNPEWAANLCCHEIPIGFSHHYDDMCACCSGECDKESWERERWVFQLSLSLSGADLALTFQMMMCMTMRTMRTTGKIRAKRRSRSCIQWNEGAGEYEATCGACGTIVYFLYLKHFHKTYLAHTRSKDCLGGY